MVPSGGSEGESVPGLSLGSCWLWAVPGVSGIVDTSLPSLPPSSRGRLFSVTCTSSSLYKNIGGIESGSPLMAPLDHQQRPCLLVSSHSWVPVLGLKRISGGTCFSPKPAGLNMHQLICEPYRVCAIIPILQMGKPRLSKRSTWLGHTAGGCGARP